MRTGSRPRILIAKPGLDGHDRGAKVVCRALTNAGMEVIYSGLHQTPLQIVHTARDEDVDAIGLSVLSGAHNTIFAKLVTLLQQEEMGEVLVFGGGTIPRKDWQGLHALGVGRIFPPGTDTRKIVAYLEDELGREAMTETSETQDVR
ncbi:MAG: cobalamin B12-binding domain-containing protein [Deltaproteobacteria bacterium]